MIRSGQRRSGELLHAQNFKQACLLFRRASALPDLAMLSLWIVAERYDGMRSE